MLALFAGVLILLSGFSSQAMTESSFDCVASFQEMTKVFEVTNKNSGVFIEGTDRHEFLVKCSPQPAPNALQCRLESGIKNTSYSKEVARVTLASGQENFTVQTNIGPHLAEVQCQRK